MNKKENKPIINISKKGMLTAFGFFLILLVFVLILDIGYIAKTLNFIPVYLFGYSTFAIYLFLFLIGVIYVLFTYTKKNKIRWYHILALLIILLSISGFSSIIVSDQIYDLNNFTEPISFLFSDYYNPYNIPFLFRVSNNLIGGGFFGYLIDALFYSIGLQSAFILVIMVLIFIIGLLILLINPIKNLIVSTKEKKKKHKENIEKQFVGYSFADLEREAKLADAESYLDSTQKERDAMPDENYLVKSKFSNQIVLENLDERKEENEKEDILLNDIKEEQTNILKEKEFEEEKEEMIMKKDVNTQTKVNDLAKQNIKAASTFDNTDYQAVEKTKSPFYQQEKTITYYHPENERIGGLQRAHFYREGSVINKQNDVEEPFISKEITPVRNIINENKNIIENKPQKVEQMTLNFDEPVEETIQIDENIISAKPTFLDPQEQNLAREVPPPVINKTEANNVVENKPKKVRRPWIPIDYNLLYEYDSGEAKEQNELTAKQRMHKINEIFSAFRVQAICSGFTIGPSVTRYNIECGQGVSVKSVERVIDDLSVRLGGVDARFVSIVAGKAYSGLEIPNAMISTVGYKEVLEKLPSREKKPLSIAFGKDIAGDIVHASMDDFPHMLISGTTGSGKSIFIHSIIMTLIMRTSPDDLKIVLVDPKQVEMSKYNDMPHLLCPIITEPSEANEAMKKLVEEMEHRYSLFKETGCSDIKQYNEYCEDHPNYDELPYVIAILDEYADLVDRCKDIARPVLSIAQKARAAGIHLLVCTQRPSTNVINGVIKGNLPTHVALMTANTTDSITIINEGGAEKLLGKGDMLVQSPVVSRVGCVRLQGCFVQNKEINRIVEFLKNNYRTIYDPAYLNLGESNSVQSSGPFSASGDKDFHDEKYEYVKSIIMGQEYASISKIVREFGFGFTRAGKIFLQLQKEGIVDTNGSARGCKVLVHDESYGVTPDLTSIESTTVEMISADTNLLIDDEE